MFTLRQLRVFEAVATHGGTAAAARALHLSQPSVSLAVRKLEEALGTALFLRRPPHGLVLTPAGRRKLAEARQLLSAADSFERWGETADGVTGRVGLAYFSTLGPTHIPRVVRAIADALPGITLDLYEGDIAEVNRRIHAGACDLALTYDLGLSSPVDGLVLQELRFYAALPADHPLARRQRVSLKQLAREDLVLIDLPHSREFLMSPFWQHELTPRIAYRATSLEMARGLVANGLGVSLLVTRPAADVAYDGRPIACRPIREKLPTQQLALSWSNQFPRTLAAAAVTDTVVAAFGGKPAAG